MAGGGRWRKNLLTFLPWRIVVVGIVLFGGLYVLAIMRVELLKPYSIMSERQAQKELSRLYGDPVEVRGAYLLVPFVRMVDARTDPRLKTVLFPAVFACGQPGTMRLLSKQDGRSIRAIAQGKNTSIRRVKSVDGSASALLAEGSDLVLRSKKSRNFTYAAIVEGGTVRGGKKGRHGLFCGRERFLDFRLAVFVPRELRVTGRVDARVEHIKEWPFVVYDARLLMEASFDTTELERLLEEAEAVFWDAVRYVVLAETQALTEAVTVRLNGRRVPQVGASLFSIDTAGQVDVLVSDLLMAAGLSSDGTIEEQVRAFVQRMKAETVRLGLEMALRGSKWLLLKPNGGAVEIVLTMNGNRLLIDADPVEWKKGKEQGRIARWRIEDAGVERTWLSPPIHVDTDRPELIRQHHRWLAAALIRNEPFFSKGDKTEVGFVPTRKVTDSQKRSEFLAYEVLDYGWQIIGAVLGGLLLLELVTDRRLSKIHYVFSGLMAVMFFLLLVGMVDHVGFPVAYGAAAVATGMVLAVYAWRLLGQRWAGGLLALIIAMAHGYFYVSLRLADYALLIGSVAGFVLLTIVLFMSVSMNRSKAGGH